jgi:hypothetical protein
MQRKCACPVQCYKAGEKNYGSGRRRTVKSASLRWSEFGFSYFVCWFPNSHVFSSPFTSIPLHLVPRTFTSYYWFHIFDKKKLKLEGIA